MSVATLENVAKLYVATFNRAPDSAGLNWWVSSSGFSLEQIAQSFFDQSETQTLYPSGTSATSFVTSVYDNLFNRAPDSAGLSYWVSELDNGRVSNQNFILAVINGALGSDATILTNKTSVGLSFANAGLEDVTLARSVMSNVDATDASVTAAQSVITQNTPADTSFQLTEAWLAGKTLYNVYDDGNDGTAETDTMTFYGNGTGFIAGEYGSGNFTYSVDANGVLTMNDPAGTSYIKVIQMDDTIGNAIRIEWTESYADALSYTNGEWYEYLATTTEATTALQQSIEGNGSGSNNTGFYFTSEWLSGRTLYDITGDEDASYTNTDGPRDLINNIITMTFNANGTLVERLGSLSMNEQWSVDSNHTIVISGGPDGTWYMRASGEELGANAYVVYSEDNYSRFSTNDHYMPEAIATDLATAQSLIGTILPAQNVFGGW